MAMQFEMKGQEQLMVAQTSTCATKELMTIGRLRMVQENREKGRALGRLNVATDVERISKWIEDDTITQEMYQEKLDQILDIGAESDRSVLAGTQLKEAGSEIMAIWNDMDRGAITQNDDGGSRARRAERAGRGREVNLRLSICDLRLESRNVDGSGMSDGRVKHHKNAAEWVMWIALSQ